MRRQDLTALLPAGLLLFFAGWAGTFFGAAGGGGAAAGHAALFACLAAAGRRSLNPLGLGPRAAWLPPALLLAVAVSWQLSPVSRAGTSAVLLLPACAAVPAAVGKCWRGDAGRRLGLPAVSLVVALIAAWSLITAWRFDAPVALPLGHHNLLASWLVILLPVAVAPWGDGGWRRAAAVLAGALGLAALIGTRSLTAALALAVVVVAMTVRRRIRWLALAAAALLLLPLLPRLARMAEFDSSLAARMGYLEAGWRGMWQRPLFGWGPGATPWISSEHLRPRPGIHPPDQIVADLHCLPLQLGYELGLIGLISIAALTVALWRRCQGHPPADRRLRRAAAAGLAAGALASLGGMPLSVTALPVAALVVLGISSIEGRAVAPPPVAGRAPAILLAVALAVFVAPLDLAHLSYDRAVAAESREESIERLIRAVDLDPGFPLYRARLAWLERDRRPAVAHPIAELARQAATDAYGVAPLWLLAGEIGIETAAETGIEETGAPWSREALIRACRLNPLAAMAPFYLALRTPSSPLGPEWGARAILSEPRLLAAPAWDRRPQLLAAAVDWATDAEGVDEGWRWRLRQTFDRGLAFGGETAPLVLTVDADDELSLSLHAFRRRPWAAELTAVDLDRRALAALDLVSAASQTATAAGVFAFRPHCGLTDLP